MEAIFSKKRREILQLTGGLAVGIGTTGCCSMRGMSGSFIEGPPLGGESIRPILKPQQISKHHKPATYCLDVHAHFFNASDVNVKGYLKQCVAHTIESDSLRRFVEHISGLVDDLVEIAPQAAFEYKFLQGMMSSPELLSVDTRSSALDSLANVERRKLAKTLFKEMQARNLGEEFKALSREHAIQRGLSPDKKVVNEFSEETVRQALDPALRAEKYIEIYGNTRATSTIQNSEPGGILEFVGHMLSYRWMSLRSYEKYYTEQNDAFGIDGVFSALVDFDYFLDCFPRSSREDQAKLHSLLSSMSGGYMLPLIGYNPWTDIKHPGTSLALVKRAVENYGFVGVKIYPPIGYLPYGNQELQKPKHQQQPNPKELDERLFELFEWCAKNGVPVMSHTGESMGRDDDADEFPRPEGWEKLLKKFENRNPPTINAGHFGGDNSKDEKNHPNNWPMRFAEIAGTHGGSNFYGDLGYWSSLTECDGKRKCDIALERLKAALQVNPKITERIMFGTDWFMLSKEPGWMKYPCRLAKNLKGILPPEELFYRNALRCFGLAPGGAQRERILQRFSRIPGGAPAWLLAA